jgi:hypothetical protein
LLLVGCGCAQAVVWVLLLLLLLLGASGGFVTTSRQSSSSSGLLFGAQIVKMRLTPNLLLTQCALHPVKFGYLVFRKIRNLVFRKMPPHLRAHVAHKQQRELQ